MNDDTQRIGIQTSLNSEKLTSVDEVLSQSHANVCYEDSEVNTMCLFSLSFSPLKLIKLRF